MSSGIVADSATSAPIRVLVLLEQARPVGLVRQLLEVLTRASRRGVEPHLVCIVREDVDVGPMQRALRGRGLRHTFIRERRSFDPGPLRQVRRLISTLRPEILESHGYKSTLYCWLLGRITGVPWVAFYHGRTSTDWKVRLYHALDRRAMGRARAIATVAEGVEAHFRKRDRERIVVIPNGVIDLDAPTGSRSEVRGRLGWTDSERIIGFVGRLSREKGPDLFLEVFARLRDRLPDLRALVVGEGPDREALKRHAARIGLTDYVSFTGSVASVAEMYEAMNLLVISSRSEVFPNVLLEAVESGLPVAAMPVGGLTTVGRGLPTVQLSDEASVERLAEAAEKALGRTGDDLRAESRRIIRERYSQDRRADLLAALYERVSGRGA